MCCFCVLRNILPNTVTIDGKEEEEKKSQGNFIQCHFQIITPDFPLLQKPQHFLFCLFFFLSFGLFLEFFWQD